MTTEAATKKVSGLDIAARAKEALTARGFVSTPGYCQMWVREVIQSLYGSEFDSFWRGSAGVTALVFEHDEWPENKKYLGLSNINELQTGDLLYKLDSPHMPNGHVGIYVAGPNEPGLVAENSSAHIHDGDARGERDLEQFGHYDLIVRLSRVNL